MVCTMLLGKLEMERLLAKGLNCPITVTVAAVSFLEWENKYLLQLLEFFSCLSRSLLLENGCLQTEQFATEVAVDVAELRPIENLLASRLASPVSR